MGRQRRRHKQLLDNLKEKRRYWNWKRKHKIALCGELTVEEDMWKSYNRLWNDNILFALRQWKFEFSHIIFHTNFSPLIPLSNNAFLRIHYHVHTTKPLELHSTKNLNTKGRTVVRLQTFTTYHPQPLPCTSIRLLSTVKSVFN